MCCVIWDMLYTVYYILHRMNYTTRCITNTIYYVLHTVHYIPCDPMLFIMSYMQFTIYCITHVI